jgi:hypothetical protein
MVRVKFLPVILISLLFLFTCIPHCQLTAKAEGSGTLVLESWSPQKVHTGMEVWCHLSFLSDQMMDFTYIFIGWLNPPEGGALYVLAYGYWAPSHSDGSGPYWLNVSAQNSFDARDVGPMIVRVEFFTTDGQQVISPNATVEVEPVQPPMNATVSCDHYSGQTPVNVQFYSNVTDGYPPYTYFWDFGDGNSSTLANPSHLYTQEIYQNPYQKPLLTVSDRYARITLVVQLIVYDPLIVEITAHKTILRPSEVQFTSTITSGYGYYDPNFPFEGWYGYYRFEWDFGDGYGSNLPNPKHTYAQSGNYHVTFKTYNSNLSTDVQTIDVKIGSEDTIPYDAILLGLALSTIGIGLGFYFVWSRHRKHLPK